MRLTLRSLTIYVYVDGSDLADCADLLAAFLAVEISVRAWKGRAPSVVNQRGDSSGLRPGDLPDWNLGLSFWLPANVSTSAEIHDFDQIVAIVLAARARFHRDFVIGACDDSSGIAEDLFHLNAQSISLNWMHDVFFGHGGTPN